MSTIRFEEMQQDLSGFFERIAAGETLVLMRDDSAIGVVTPVTTAAKLDPRPYGLCAGQFRVPDDFDVPFPDEIVKDFAGLPQPSAEPNLK